MKRGIGAVIAGVVLFLAGVAVVPGVIIFTLIRDDSGAKQFLVPGALEVTVAESGRYYLWNDFRTLFHGQTFNSSEDLPGGIAITISDSTGKALEFISYGSISSSSGSSSKRSIGYVEVSAPGTLTVEVSGAVEPRVFSFARSRIDEFIAWMVGGLVACILFSMTGIAVGILGVVRLLTAKPQEGMRGGTGS